MNTAEVSRDQIAHARIVMCDVVQRMGTLKDETIAQTMKRDRSWASKLRSGETGIKLEDLDAFLGAIGLKVVAEDALVVTPEAWQGLQQERKALRTLLRKELAQDQE